jgi:hypothetical protein
MGIFLREISLVPKYNRSSGSDPSRKRLVALRMIFRGDHSVGMRRRRGHPETIESLARKEQESEPKFRVIIGTQLRI